MKLISAVNLFILLSVASSPAVCRAAETGNQALSQCSPKVNADGSLSPTFYAPLAKTVNLHIPAAGIFPLQRDSAGFWSATTTPLESDAYSYWFEVDSVRTLDPGNPYVVRDIASLSNVVIVPGERGALYAPQNVAHGDISYVWYNASSLGIKRRMAVYTPPGYNESGAATYPVLYLLHGSGGDETAWLTLGAAANILDNLIAAGKAKPMIVVMPNGNPGEPAAPGFTSEGLYLPSGDRSDLKTARFEESYPDIKDYVESNYRVDKSKSHRAVAGLSMGGGQTFRLSAMNPDDFDFVGMFSPYIRFGEAAAEEDGFAATVATPLSRQFANAPKLYLIAIGNTDFLYGNCEAFRKYLDSTQIPYQYKESTGGHEWRNWRKYLADFLQLLF